MIHGSRSAKYLRAPEPRFKSENFPLCSSNGRFDSTIQPGWPVLDPDVWYNGKDLMGDCADVLVTFFSPDVRGFHPHQNETS